MAWEFHNDLFEIAIFPLLPVHHVMKNRDHDIPNFSLRHQSDAKKWTHHSWDEVGLVVSCIVQIHTNKMPLQNFIKTQKT